MRSLARRFIAVLLVAVLSTTLWPQAAWAEAGKPAGAPQTPPIDPKEAMAYFKKLGVFKDDSDIIKTYLGDDKKLTPIGITMYRSLKSRYNPNEEVTNLTPTLDRLREMGPYDAKRAENVRKAQEAFTAKFGSIDSAPAGSMEQSFRTGAMREAMMNGATVTDPPQGTDFFQVKNGDFYEFYDREGLAFRMTQNKVTTYSRDVQRNQRKMNLTRPPDCPDIPETGRYNYPMFMYSYLRLKTQYDEYAKARRIDRMILMAELLGKSYPNDLWFEDKTLEADLQNEAKSARYGKWSVLELVDSRFKQRDAYLYGSKNPPMQGATDALAAFKSDMESLKGKGDITPGMVQTMALNEQNTLRWLSLTVLETQMFHVKNQKEKVDPTSPESIGLQKAIDETGMTSDQKIRYKAQGVIMKNRLEELRKILDDVRNKLNSSDYAGSLEMVQAALGSTQKELGEISTDYSIYLDLPSSGYLAKTQVYDGYNPIRYGIGALWSAFDGNYRRDMNTLKGNGGESVADRYTRLAGLIASGRREDWAAVRADIIKKNPTAADYMMTATLGGEAPKVNDALRISASLDVTHKALTGVMEKNKTIDAVTAFLTWTIAIALLAPVARMGLNLVGRLSGPSIQMIQRGAARGFLAGLPERLVGRVGLVFGEVAKHTAARLKSLEPGAAQVTKYGGESFLGRYLAASTMRATTVAARQASFTVLSGTISAGFTVLNHGYDVATGGHPMFSKDLEGFGDAALAGFKGGAWWANESFHPALGYVGLPSTVFGGTRLAGAMETFGTRGVVGSAFQTLKSIAGRGVAAEAASGEAASMGLLERWSQAGGVKAGAAFGLSMADNVAKYALFSKAVGWLGEGYAWNIATNPIVTEVPGLGWKVTGKYAENDPDMSEEDRLARRIRRTNIIKKEWEESPAWLLIPTYAAHAAAEAAPYLRAREGALQYDKEGRTAEYLKFANGESVDFLKPVKPPVSQRIFEAHFFADPAPTKWTMTEQIRRAGIRKELVRMLAGPEGKIEQINPLEFYRMSKLKDNERFVNVYMNDEVRLVAHQDFVDALLARPKATAKALEVKPGTVVEGLGRITPEIQMDIAVALYTAEGMAGKKVPKALSEKVNTILAPYLEANKLVTPYAEAFVKAVNKAPKAAPKLDAELGEMRNAVREWAAGGGEFGKTTYDALVVSLKAKADAKLKAGQLSAEEHAVMKGLYDYVLAIEQRFNKFNKVETVMGLNGTTIDALRTEFSGKPEVVKVLDGFTRDLKDWSSKRPGKAVDGPKADGSYGDMMAKFGTDLQAALQAKDSRITSNEATALSKAINDMKAAPWVLHDSKGDPLPSWRPAQFVSFVEALTEVASGEGKPAEGSNPKEGDGGRGGGAIRLFQKLTTGGGKTMMTFEGLLPLAEADAAARKMEVTFLTVQSNLEAQARMEFIAYRKIGSKLTFDTYEGFKTKIAEGKMKGRNALKKYWILGDEMDGAALQPALTIGQVSGYVTRRSGVSQRLDDIDVSLGRQLERGRLERGANILTEARRIGTLFDSLAAVKGDTPEGAILKAEAQRLERAADKLSGSGGDRGEMLIAEAQVRESMGRIKDLIDTLPARELDAVTTAKESLARLEKAIDTDPGANKALRESLLAELETGLKQQKLLLGIAESETGFASLKAEAHTQLTALDAKIERLEGELKAAEDSKANGAKLRAEGLRQELELTKMERAVVERFDAVDASTRLMRIEEQIAAIEQGEAPRASESGGNAKLEGLKREAARLEGEMTAESAKLRKGRAADLVKAETAKGKIDSLKADIYAAKQAGKPTAKLEARLEKAKAERADALKAAGEKEKALAGDPAAVALGKLEPRIRQMEKSTGETVETGPAADAAKLAELRSQAGQIEASLPPEQVKAHEGYRAQLKRVYELGKEMGKTDEALLAAKDKGDKAAELAAKEKLTALETERATTRASLKSMEMELASGDAAGDLGAMMRKLETVSADVARYEGLVEGANARGERAGPLKSKLRSLRSEESRLRNEIRSEVYDRLEKTGQEIVDIVKSGEPGWAEAAGRLLERRRGMMESFVEAENPMYEVYRQMKEDAYPIANNEALLTGAETLRDQVEFLKTQVEQLSAFEKSGEKNAKEALPFLAEASKFHEDMKARVAEKEAALKELELSKDASETALKLRRSEVERARIEVSLVERFLALETPGAERPAPLEIGDVLAKLDRMSVESEAVTKEAARTLKMRIDGLPLMKFLPKAMWSALTGKEMKIEDIGLTRKYSLKMLKALFNEPMMDLGVRDNLMWSFIGSLLFPKGLLHGENGSSWVRNEFINLVQGYKENPAGVRKDGRRDKFNVVHNGQWFESMDNATRRWWELEYGVDLTLPYTHQSISTIKDVTTFKGARFISLSGTAGEKFLEHMSEQGVRLMGKGSEMPGKVEMDVVSGAGARFTRIKEALMSVMEGSHDRVVLRPSDLAPLREKAEAGKGTTAGVKEKAILEAIDAYMAGSKLKSKDNAVIEIGKIESKDAQEFLRGIRSTQKDTGLVVLSVSDTRVLKVVIDYLQRSGVKPEEIAKVFSDSEYLRLNVPEAKVGQQMNLDALNTGKVKVLILDTRVGGRGLDLNFKGDRANPAPDAFRGYTNMEMLVIDPEAMSQVHLLQAMGRIDKGRVLAGVDRDFSLVMDVGSVKSDAIFRRMFFEDPFFIEMRKDPVVQRYALSKGLKTVDLELVHDYVMSRQGDKGEGDLLAERYRKAVKTALEKRQAEVESDQLRSSSVLQDRPSVPAKYPGLQLIR